MKSLEQAERLARIVAQANETFGDPEKARRWLNRPTSALDNRSPICAAETEQGAADVEAILARINHGLAT